MDGDRLKFETKILILNLPNLSGIMQKFYMSLSSLNLIKFAYYFVLINIKMDNIPDDERVLTGLKWLRISGSTCG